MIYLDNSSKLLFIVLVHKKVTIMHCCVLLGRLNILNFYTLFHCSKAKMVAMLLEGIHFIASVEALSLGAKAGIHPWIIYDIISNAAGNSWCVFSQYETANFKVNKFVYKRVLLLMLWTAFNYLFEKERFWKAGRLIKKLLKKEAFCITNILCCLQTKMLWFLHKQNADCWKIHLNGGFPLAPTCLHCGNFRLPLLQIPTPYLDIWLR